MLESTDCARKCGVHGAQIVKVRYVFADMVIGNWQRPELRYLYDVSQVAMIDDDESQPLDDCGRNTLLAAFWYGKRYAAYARSIVDTLREVGL